MDTVWVTGTMRVNRTDTMMGVSGYHVSAKAPTRVHRVEAVTTLLFPAAFLTNRLMVGGFASVVLMVVAVWQSLKAPSTPPAPKARTSARLG